MTSGPVRVSCRVYGVGRCGPGGSFAISADAFALFYDFARGLQAERVQQSGRSGLSACIISYNEADRIEACLRSVSFCDEIIVVDSHSTDGTRELASALGARVIERDWPGYRTQKQFAVDSA